MANTLTLNATRANSTLPIEFYNPATQQWVDGVRQGNTDAYQLVLTGIPAGQYGAGTSTPLRCRLKGSSPAIEGTFAQLVTVVGANNGALKVNFDTGTRLLSADYASLSDVEYSYQNGSYAPYAVVSVDAAAHPAGDWLYRVRAKNGQPAGAAVGSPVIVAKSTAPSVNFVGSHFTETHIIKN